jgi:predicted ATPase/transcriptional regulator with XRE-family HTH domain
MNGGLRKRAHSYLNVPSTTVNDGRLSFKARGILAYLLDKPAGWDVRSVAIAADSPDGKAAVQAGLRELARAGYYRIERRRLLDGRLVTGTAVSEEPVASWAAEYAEYQGPVPVVQQPGRSPYVAAHRRGTGLGWRARPCLRATGQRRGGPEGEGPVAEQPGLSFAGLLRRLRDEAQLTQEELAEAARVSQRAVSDLERGINRTARKDTALLLADALGLDGQARDLFISAARGRAPAAGVLAALRRQADAAPLAAAGGLRGFPAALTSFIGREAAMGQVAGLLEENRLVTVTGPGGSGKTRLAGEVARQVAGRFADGVWLVELARVQDAAQVPAVAAVALGVREQPGLTAAGALARALARQQLLLVLDNCEHVIGAAAALCAGLLTACDDVRILATSREPLRVAGEARYRLAPLALPDPDDLADAAGAEAVALFADRARSADAQFALTGEATPTVAGLDGMPLAIELAAAQVEALGVAQLLDRLDQRFALLTAGDRLAAGRQRSLAATVEWSYQLLGEREQRVFRQISVIAGAFTLEAAEAVARQGAAPAVARLVDCSLLTPPRTGPDGRLRYSMLETLRAYGAGLLAEAGEQDQAAAALAGYALQVAEQADAGLQTMTGEQDAARWLDAEDATMRQVLAWAMGHDPQVAVRLAGALGWWWLLRGRLPGQYRLLREVTGHAEPGSDRWCAAQFWLGWAAMFSSDWPGALDCFTALRDAVGERPSRALADGLAGRSAALRELSQIPEAAEDARRSLAVARELGYPMGEVLALAHLALAAAAAGDLGDAVRWARQADQFPGDIPALAARACSYWLTGVLIQAGDFAAAERVCAAGLAASRDAGDLQNQPVLLSLTAMLELWSGRVDDAAAHLREALQISLRAGSWLVDYLEHCGYLCAATGRYAEAVTAWAAHAVLLPGRAWPGDLRLRQKPLRAARQALGPDRARAAEKRGAAMSWATAAEYALMLAGPARSKRAVRGQGWQCSAPGNGSWSPWSPRAAPTSRSPPSSTSASARSAPTWTGSGTRPAATAAPTSPALPLAPNWSSPDLASRRRRGPHQPVA